MPNDAPVSDPVLPPALDVVTIGRSSVDLYGEQAGGRLEDMSSFAKYVGGCPTNIAIGTAKLGLHSGLITAVGDEHMGRFVKEEVERWGVDTGRLKTDPARLTSLVILGIRDEHSFPLIFFRENCADSALDEGDIDEAYIAGAKAVVVTGTHFSRPNLDRASRKAATVARAKGRKVILDIDYRPVLWGLTGHGLGEERFVESGNVSAHLQTILPLCDVVVGTEEELHIAGGSTDTLAAIRTVREHAPDALIVCKRGPMGCVAFPGAIPDDIEEGIKGPGFPVDVYNVLGAGDAFMSGFLRGYLRDLPVLECCRLANACGAFAVSRHGCAPAIPSWIELSHFLEHGSPERALRKDRTLEQLHWSTNRERHFPQVLAFAFDHRSQLEAIADEAGVSRPHIAHFKSLCWLAVERQRQDRSDLGILLDGRYGGATLPRATGQGIWIGRPIELPGSRPLRFDDGPDLGRVLREWPREHCVKCLAFYHPDDPAELRELQVERLQILQDAARGTFHDLLIEIIASKSGLPEETTTLARAIRQLYGAGLFPDWWKLPDPGSDAAWRAVADTVGAYDPHCRGILLLGLEAPEATLEEAFRRAADQPICKGFAVGRSIFGSAALDWFSGKIDDAAAIDRMAATYGRLIEAWDRARAGGST
jgi:5-dehydro-2-deoxygluconokinase